MPDLYAFDRFEVRPAGRQLLIDGAPAALGARAFDVLVALIERHDRVVTKDELFDAVWPGLVVEENNLQVQVSSLRKLLGAKAIATIPGRGYQFVAALDALPANDHRSASNPNNLPRPRTRFIGREKALADCANLLNETRLLTLLGIGGCGKTRLAQELAQRQLGAFPDGAWFVDLGPLQEARRVPETVAAALGIQDDSSAPLRNLADHLESQRMLVVLDNCEHVIDAAVESIEALLSSSSALKVVATSREALGVAGEQVYAVRSLSLPASGDLAEIRKSEAVRLFVDHARLVLPEFDVGERNAAAIAEICRRLDGIALAIELAAARVRVLSVDDIHARLDDRFRLLTGGNRALPRHQTLQATMQWSHELLTPPERRLFRRLAVFAGGCTLAAAAQVAGGGADEYETLERLTALHDKSLLIVDRDTTASPRYRMLETVRQYAEERLNEAGESDEMRTKHLRYFAALAEQFKDDLRGSHPETAYAILRADAENLLAALAWSSHAEDGGELALRLIGAAWRYWRASSEPDRGYALAQSALHLAAEGADSEQRFETMFAMAEFGVLTGRYEATHAYAERCLAMARRMNDARLISSALTDTAIGLMLTGDEAQALARLAECCDFARSMNDRVLMEHSLNNMAEVYRGSGDFARAESLYREALGIARSLDRRRDVASSLYCLAMVLVATERSADARTALAEAVAIDKALGEKHYAKLALDASAVLAGVVGDHAVAARLHGAALARMRESRSKHEPVDERFIAARIASSRASMGEAAFAAAEAAGSAMSYEAAFAEMEAWLASTDAGVARTPPLHAERIN